MDFSNLTTTELSFYLGNINENDNNFYFINENEEGKFPILQMGEFMYNILHYDFHKWSKIIRNAQNDEPIPFVNHIIQSTKIIYDEVFSILLNNLVIDLLKQLDYTDNYEKFYSDLYKNMHIETLYKRHYGEYPTNQSNMKELYYGFVPYIGTYLNHYKAFLKSFFHHESNPIDIQMFPTSLNMGYKILPKLDIQGKTHFFQEFYTVDNLLDLSMFEVLKIIERKISINL